MDLLSEWKRLLNGAFDVDFLEFAGLIPHDATEIWLRDAFDSLPNGHIMIQRLRDLLQENASNGAYILPKRENYLGQNEIQNLAAKYRDNLLNYLHKHGYRDAASDIKGSDFSFVYDNDDFLSVAMDPSRGLSEAEYEVRNDFVDISENTGYWTFALYEAVFSLTNNSAVSRYILEDMVCLDLDSRAYYELWRGGGDVCFMKGRILLLCEVAPS